MTNKRKTETTGSKGKGVQGGKATTTDNSSFCQKEEGPHVVILADLNSNRFDPLTKSVPHCLLPIGNVPILHFTISMLITDGFRNIIIFACRHANLVRSFIDKAGYSNASPELQISVINGEGNRNLGDVMRDLDSSSKLQGVTDFLLIHADLICGISLAALLRKHKDRRSQNPKSVMTLVFPPSTSLLNPSQLADLGVTCAFSRTEGNKLIKFFRTANNERILLNELMPPGQLVEVYTGLIDVGIAICSSHIPPLFQDDFDYAKMDDLIAGVLIDEDVLHYVINVEILPKGPPVLLAAPDLSSLIDLTPRLLARQIGSALYLPPCLIGQSKNQCGMIAIGPQSYISSSAKIHPKARLIGACFISDGCEISKSACLIDCCLGPNCYVGQKARLRRVIALDSVHIGDCVKADVAWLCSKARLLAGFHLPHKCFVGSSETTPVTLGPGKGNLPPKSILVAPGPRDLVLDCSVGGDQVWACFYNPQNSRTESLSLDNDDSDLMDNKSSEVAFAVSNDETTNSATLWQTAWDAVKGRARAKRHGNHLSVSRTGESRSSRSSGLNRHLSGNQFNDGGADDMDSDADIKGLGGASDDEIDKSEAFVLDELKHTLERSLENSHDTANIILEVNSLKHAYNIPIEDLYSLLMKSILELSCSQMKLKPNKSNSATAASTTSEDKACLTEFITLLRKNLDSFHGVLNSYMTGSDTADRMYLEAVEELACDNQLILNSVHFVFDALYNKDLVSEEAIGWWKDNSSLLADDELAEKTRAVREKLTPFLTWLEQADEDDSDDENRDE